MTNRNITAVKVLMATGKFRWKFEMDSILHPGQRTRSLHTWASKQGALIAARRVWEK